MKKLDAKEGKGYGVKPYDLESLSSDELAYREKFVALLRRNHFNVTRVAEELETSRVTIYRRCRILQIKLPTARRNGSLFTRDDAITAKRERGTYLFAILGSVEDGFTCAEIQTDEGDPVARVHESGTGWNIHLTEPARLSDRSLVEALGHAQAELLHYPNRQGQNPPPNLTPAEMSLWLMQREKGPMLEDEAQ